MKRAYRRLPVSLGAFALVFAFASSTRAAEKQVKLTRSIYVPVEFSLCEHLHDGVLYDGDQALTMLPAKRIFQFTFYPDLERIVPVRSDVRVEGLRDSGEEFVGKLAVTPWGIFTAKDSVELDMDKQMARLRYKIDVRYETVDMRLRCSDSCERAPAAQTADAGTECDDPIEWRGEHDTTVAASATPVALHAPVRGRAPGATEGGIEAPLGGARPARRHRGADPDHPLFGHRPVERFFPAPARRGTSRARSSSGSSWAG